ncbi:PEP-CTERM sorting domain-containing protein [Haloferula sp.]|uniref:PEP-CTERM sorting domain-containing protein n=1 Tax=Haloferula sp. TaxID=2497595 RepID=UPI0032A0FBBA
MKPNMKKIILIGGITLSSALASQAALITIDNIDPVAGSYSDFTSTGTGDSFSLTRTFDFDGGGTDDTLTFTLTRTTYATGTIAGLNVTVGAVNAGGNTVNWYSNFGDAESIQLVVSGITYTSGEADGTTVVFDGFQGIGRTNFTSGTGAGNAEIDYHVHTGPVGSTIITNTGGTHDLTSAGSSTNVFLTAETGSGGIRLRDVDLQFSTVAIPEPSSAALLGLGALALLVRRRK